MKMNITPEQFRFIIEDVTAELIQYLVEHEHYEIPAAISAIYSSELYQALCRPETGLYVQSTGYIREYLMHEFKTGKLA
ncbi:MAG: hypothetical protein SOZ58_10000 [Prevotella sp.]|nr:hypothetical protein [Prevotella sp.]